jgi:DMSO/TMAO reductase YedYZ molybdopterin-dependent catalytic subunit
MGKELDREGSEAPPVRQETPGEVIRAAPLNREAAREQLDAWLTHRHFVRCNFDIPRIDPAAHRLMLEGAVARPACLSLAALRAFGARSRAVTLECAGNGRLGLAPLPAGEPWGQGAVSTAVWTGAPLTDVLSSAGIRDDVVEVLFTSTESPRPFQRSLPLDKALEGEALLAWEMNGAPIPPEHGGPLRLVVPGWYGMASVKWLARMELLTAPFEGHFQRERYVVERRPVGPLQVKSLLTRPAPGALVSAGGVTVEGWAWSSAEVVEVALSLDGSTEWVPAELLTEGGGAAWRRFRTTLRVEGVGRHTLRARARDAKGRAQPEAPSWNALGYENNAVETVAFRVE